MLAQLDETIYKAIQGLEPRTFDYYFANRYVPHTHALAQKAELMLWLKHPDLARKFYFQAIDALKDGINRRPEVMREKAQDAQNAAVILNVASGAAGRSSSPASELVGKGLKVFAQGALSISRQLHAEANVIKNLKHADAEGDVFRMPVLQTGLFKYIGQLFNPGGTCTAFQVKWRIVVTNAHCVVRDDGTIYKPSDLRIVMHSPEFFEPFFIGNGITTYVQKVVVSDAYLKTKNFADDWAVLVTKKSISAPDGADEIIKYGPQGASASENEPVGKIMKNMSKRLGFKGKKFWNFENNEEIREGLDLQDISDRLKQGSKIAIAGYSGDINSGNILMMDYGCPVVNNSNRYDYKCSTFPGNSGGPIFAGDVGEVHSRGDEPFPLTVIGVHSCGNIMVRENLKFQQTRSKLGGCGVKASKFMSTVKREYDLLPDFR